MYKEYLVKNNLINPQSEDYYTKLQSIKNVFNSGITLSLFIQIIVNLHNEQGMRPDTWNNKTIDEWVEFLNPSIQEDNVNETQLYVLFEYLVNHHNRLMIKQQDIYKMMVKSITQYSDNFNDEYTILNFLET